MRHDRPVACGGFVQGCVIGGGEHGMPSLSVPSLVQRDVDLVVSAEDSAPARFVGGGVGVGNDFSAGLL
jgi:hypothetical protein